MLALAFLLSFNLLLPVSALAADAVQQGVCSGAQNLHLEGTAAACPTGTAETKTFNTIITEIINLISVIVAVIAVIMIVIAGFRYITSGGSSDKISSAKSTLLYAIIGLIIVALAQVIVRFVLAKTTKV